LVEINAGAENCIIIISFVFFKIINFSTQNQNV